MTRSEIAKILALAAARDRRTVGRADVAAWTTDLAGITYDEAEEAVSRHFRETTDWLMPAHIIAHVKDIRAEAMRRRPHEVRALPSRWEPDEQRAARAKAGHELCMAVIGEAAATAEIDLDPHDPVRNRALKRARAERRATTHQEHP